MIPALKLICWLLGILLNQIIAFELYEFHAKDVPNGAFNQLVEKTGWNYVKCISICKEHEGCNALQVDDQSCRMGWLNLGYRDPEQEESRIKVFADQDYLCTYKVRSLWQIPQIAANGKIFFLSSLTKDSTENRKFCQSYGAEEVMLKNRAEFNAFNKLIGTNDAHIGLYFTGKMVNCRNEQCLDDFKWADGSAFRWSRTHYNDLVINTGDPCMRINPSEGDFEMQDNECHRIFRVACQIDCKK